MGPPQADRMSASQRNTVSAALSSALSEGKRFGSLAALRKYLEDLVAPKLLQNHISEIFDCYLKLETEQPPSPSLTTSLSEPGSLDAENTPEDSDTEGPAFAQESERFLIDFFRPQYKNLHVITARYCQGRVSYISANIAKRHLLRARKDRTVLSWSHLGRPNERACTRCEIIDQELLPNCDIALAEHHGTEDAEDAEEEEVADGPTIGTCTNNLVVARPFQAMTMNNFTPEEQSEVARITAEMNLTSAMTMITSTKRTAEQLASSQFNSTSYNIETTHKKAKLS